MKTLANAIKTGNLPHLLFYGSPGTGKTTTILALAYELFGPNKFKERVLELKRIFSESKELQKKEWKELMDLFHDHFLEWWN